jgi:hypothetical protein
MNPRARFALTALLAATLVAASRDPFACEKDSQCRPPKVCKNRECVSAGAAVEKPVKHAKRTSPRKTASPAPDKQ